MQQDHADIVALLDDARRLDLRALEDAPQPVVLAASVQLGVLLERAIARCHELARRLDTRPPAALHGELHEEGLRFGLTVDGAPTRQPRSRWSNTVGDLAFVAALELRPRLERLRRHTAGSDGWELVCDCGSALRRLRRSLGALEVALSHARGVAPRSSFEAELRVSLEVRRLYRQLWDFVAQHRALDASNVREALRGAGVHCAALVGRTMYGHLRERDRYELRLLQKRILNVLLQEDDPRACLRVWEDFAGFVEMLRQINNRQELREHDRAALQRAEAHLASAQLADALEALRTVAGLDERLDAAAASGELQVVRTEATRVLEWLSPRDARPDGAGLI
jgi:hypothetical protein